MNHTPRWRRAVTGLRTFVEVVSLIAAAIMVLIVLLGVPQ